MLQNMVPRRHSPSLQLQTPLFFGIPAALGKGHVRLTTTHCRRLSTLMLFPFFPFFPKQEVYLESNASFRRHGSLSTLSSFDLGKR